MTATRIVQTELERFITSSDPEVLCLTGDWGVGKTFSWQAALDDSKRAKTHALSRYSYVSLFGINSLEGMKLSLFENLEFLIAPPESLAQRGFRNANALFSHSKKLNAIASALPYVGGVLAKAGPLYFSLIREQIICIDDLERKGNGLELKDVFGLVSFLKEQRKCKLILLLNSDALENATRDFDTYFEKVIDARLVFAPKANEAASIALKSTDPISTLLRENVEVLDISNIRVIKKIERLIRRIEPIVTGLLPDILKQAIHTITLVGWSKYQPTVAPPLSFLQTNQTARYLELREKQQKMSSTEQAWTTLLTRYNFRYLDEFDAELQAFVDKGVLDEEKIRAAAIKLDAQIRLRNESSLYSSAWRLFHDSFADNAEDVARSIVDGIINSRNAIGLSNLNESVQLLREIGREADAEKVIRYFRENKGIDFWTSRDHFRQPLDPTLDIVVSEVEQAAATPLTVEQALVKAAHNYDAELIKRLAELPIEEYYDMIKSKTGDDMRQLIFSGLEFRKISNASTEMREVVRRVEESLKKIGAESPLNAARIQRYGVSVEPSA